MNKLFNRLKAIFVLFAFYSLKPFGFVSKKLSKKPLLLFCERGFDAQDNSYYLFKYIKKNNPEFNCKFIIEKKAVVDIKDEDRINLKSLKNIFYLNKASAIISTHYMLFVPCSIAVKNRAKLFKFGAKIIFLSHGITTNYHDLFIYPNFKADVLNTSVQKEYDYMKKTYGQPENVVMKLGMPRYDNLFLNRANSNNYILKTIFIMPTWRRWIVNDPDFKGTDYFKQWSSFLENGKILDFCRDNHIKIIFSLHYEAMKFRYFFEPFANDIVEIYDRAGSGAKRLQELLIESNLLITDYSSVAFDFAYLNKPVIYYQFDKESFYEHHYRQGFFDISRDGFGNVFIDELGIYNYLSKFNYSEWFSKYSENIRNFFADIDGNSCYRVTEKIKSLIK